MTERHTTLVISLRPGDSVQIGGDVLMKVASMRANGKRAEVVFTAPPCVKIQRRPLRTKPAT